MNLAGKIFASIVILSSLLLAGCGKQLSREEKGNIALAKACQTLEELSSQYDQELDVITNENDSLKIKDLLGEIIGDKKFKPNFADIVFNSVPADMIPFHKYSDIIASDIYMLQGLITPLNKYKDIPQANLTLEKVIDLLDNLNEIKTYVIKHREYRDEERYLALRTRSRWG